MEINLKTRGKSILPKLMCEVLQAQCKILSITARAIPITKTDSTGLPKLEFNIKNGNALKDTNNANEATNLTKRMFNCYKEFKVKNISKTIR